jgi:hypothetical protein
VGLIPSQGKREVWFLFRFDGVQNIHATIDDNDELDEMHEDNNHAYSLLFHDMANSGYTLQTLRLDPAIAVSPVVASDGSGLTIGYHVTATVLGDTFTRANVLVQLWHGGVGGTGRLIGTVLVPRVNGSTNETNSSEVSIFWETRNPTLFGKQELHAVILHSGFSTEAANVISHVSRTVSVACYGRVDACGVCGGNDGTCGGCDGVALSGKTVDACGVCGGTGSTCCIPKPSQAQWHYVRIDHHHHNSNIHNGDTKRTSTNGSSTAAASASSSSSSLVTWVRVGDLVVWENLLDRKVEITGGAYDYNGAPAVDLSRFNGQPDHDHDHDQVDNHGLGVLLAVPLLPPPARHYFGRFESHLPFFVLGADHVCSSGSKTSWKWPWIPLVAGTDRRRTLQRSTFAAGPPPLHLPCRHSTTMPSCSPAGPSTLCFPTFSPLFFASLFVFVFDFDFDFFGSSDTNHDQRHDTTRHDTTRQQAGDESGRQRFLRDPFDPSEEIERRQPHGQRWCGGHRRRRRQGGGGGAVCHERRLLRPDCRQRRPR